MLIVSIVMFLFCPCDEEVQQIQVFFSSLVVEAVFDRKKLTQGLPIVIFQNF